MTEWNFHTAGPKDRAGLEPAKANQARSMPILGWLGQPLPDYSIARHLYSVWVEGTVLK